MSEDEVAPSASDEEPTEEAEIIEADEEIREPTIEELLDQTTLRAENAEKEIAYRDAEIANLRKRHAKERGDLIRYGGQGLARKLISLLDDFDRAISAAPAEVDGAVFEGLTMIRNNLDRALTSDGASRIEAEGLKFDPKTMEAITTIPASEEYPPSIVVQVLEEGWMLHDRVLRAARVVVTAVE